MNRIASLALALTALASQAKTRTEYLQGTWELKECLRSHVLHKTANMIYLQFAPDGKAYWYENTLQNAATQPWNSTFAKCDLNYTFDSYMKLHLGSNIQNADFKVYSVSTLGLRMKSFADEITYEFKRSKAELQVASLRENCDFLLLNVLKLYSKSASCDTSLSLTRLSTGRSIVIGSSATYSLNSFDSLTRTTHTVQYTGRVLSASHGKFVLGIEKITEAGNVKQVWFDAGGKNDYFILELPIDSVRLVNYISVSYRKNRKIGNTMAAAGGTATLLFLPIYALLAAAEEIDGSETEPVTIFFGTLTAATGALCVTGIVVANSSKREFPLVPDKKTSDIWKLSASK